MKNYRMRGAREAMLNDVKIKEALYYETDFIHQLLVLF